MGATLDNPLPNGDFKTCSDARCLFCKHTINTNSFRSPIMGRTYKILDNTSCHKDYFCKVCSKQLIGETGDLRKSINNHLSTTNTKNSTKLFNVRCHQLEGSGVINHNPHWTDAERKSQKNFGIHRLKSFRLNPINKQIDIIKMNVS